MKSFCQTILVLFVCIASATAQTPKGTTPAEDSSGNYTVQVQYPKKALRRGIEGTVVVRFQIKPDGTTGKILITNTTDSIFDNAVIEAVKKATFNFPDGQKPAKPFWTSQTITFRLQNNGKKRTGETSATYTVKKWTPVRDTSALPPMQLKYPPNALKKGEEGAVEVRFMVQADGSVGKIEILKSTDTGI